MLLSARCKSKPYEQGTTSGQNTKTSKTYNTGHSPVVTDPTTTPALTGLSMGERTGSRVFQWVWSYVVVRYREIEDMAIRVSEFPQRTNSNCSKTHEESYDCLGKLARFENNHGDRLLWGRLRPSSPSY
ncbi:hypothetical protein CCHR01_02363 [Colletotrichum chrysophilum]|uniref:Uncharacterized protein n=1 Tax=Colletotrichum chrysophilum TaxID=1836956 RepID=A0AAD9EKB7_9PEZI|nr:hypothetical protein CCHR01_02363 [Colletotrichum chrysophilum]